MRSTLFLSAIFITIVLLMISCESKTQAINCEYEPKIIETVRLGTIQTPIKGRIVVESHYVTAEDKLSDYPKYVTEKIERHLEISCNYLASLFSQTELGYGCSKVYNEQWEKVWTPSEDGNIGQGARGNLRPPVSHELWQANMYFKPESFPAPGEKWIVKNPSNQKSVVVVMGYEIGPGGYIYKGGMSVESHFAIGSNNDSILEIGKAKDQSILPGPIKCY